LSISSGPDSAGAPAAPLAFIDLQAQRRRLGGRIEAAIARVLEHGRFIMGPEVAELEQELARSAGVRHAISVASGTDALLLPLMAWGIGPGDAVFVPAFTFAGTAEAPALLGATPVLVDVREPSCNLDTESLEAAVRMVLADGRLRPRAVIPVDLFGLAADYEALRPIAERYELKLLQDAAQSFGGRWQDRPVGGQGDAAATSFYPAKPLGAYGDGGAILTDDDRLAEVARSIRVHGTGPGGAYDHVRLGMTARLDTLQAAILLVKLEVLQEEMAARQAVAARYQDGLAGLLDLPPIPEAGRSAWAQYTIRSDDRDRIVAGLRIQGVPTAIHYPKPLHHQPAFHQCPRAPGGLAVAEALAARVLSLPMHADLARADQDRVLDGLRRILVEKRT
jgi:dTDP-4-amino-4,6-dideoxygalactose transaminase